MSEHAELIGLIVALLGGREAIAQGIKWWAGYRERRAKARESLERAELAVEHTEAEVSKTAIGALKAQIDLLAARLGRVERENADLREALKAEQAARAREQEDCKRRVEALERRLATRRDNTGRHRLGVVPLPKDPKPDIE
jgi:chromosome segregation ATPase